MMCFLAGVLFVFVFIPICAVMLAMAIDIITGLINKD